MSHTPGPWGFTYDGSGDYSIGLADDPQVDPIATVRERRAAHKDWEEATANAQLIAAAPELLSALRVMVGIYRALAEQVHASLETLPTLLDAERAVAKAEGR